eukprot:161030-Rhodomonas_salina.1
MHQRKAQSSRQTRSETRSPASTCLRRREISGPLPRCRKTRLSSPSSPGLRLCRQAAQGLRTHHLCQSSRTLRWCQSSQTLLQLRPAQGARCKGKGGVAPASTWCTSPHHQQTTSLLGPSPAPPPCYNSPKPSRPPTLPP